jgi:hypothetical protein
MLLINNKETLPKSPQVVLGVNLEVFSHFGGVSGANAYIVKDHNGFTTQLGSKYILATCDTDDFLELGISAREYFEEKIPEYFV